MKAIPVSPRHPKRISSPTVCWRRDLAIPHESLWGRWNKLELFNRSTGQDIRAYLRAPQATRELAWERSAEPGDSRVQGVLNGKKLAKLSAPGFACTVGVIADYFPVAEKSRFQRDLWTAPDLKYCPQCLKAGAHVTYFQFWFVERCPVHGVTLLSNCPSCRKPAEYRHGRDECCSRFSCACGRPLWDWARKPVCRVTEDLKGRHADAGAWMLAAMQHARMLHFPWAYGPDSDECDNEVDPVQAFATVVATAFPELGRLRCNFNDRLAQQIVTTRVGGYLDGASQSDRLRLVAVYKSICRYFRRRLLRRHKSAIAKIERLKSRPLCGNFGELEWTAPFAPAASAFIAWRMYWEGIKSPIELRGCRGDYVPAARVDYGPVHWTIALEERFHNLVSSPKWNAHARLSSEIRVCWFAQVCLRTFDECLLRIHHEFQNRAPIDGRVHWRFTTKWINGAMIPSMLPRCEKDGTATLFWISRARTADFPRLVQAVDQSPSKDDFRHFKTGERRAFERLSRAFSEAADKLRGRADS